MNMVVHEPTIKKPTNPDYIVERINKLLSSMNIDARISLVEDVLSALVIEQKIEALNSGDLMIKDAAGIRC
ncbi:hypothetical protein [Fibrobacter sp. UWT3]|uniref:hypothetical protein n=1 Tax=Fibrobacter sp. UWT3 TaxID=1896225 RepID=UPI00114253EA|nr:hypothetical protein [Fibrobacter sp. UWT3]